MSKFLAIHPVLSARDVSEAIEFYVGKLGFSLIFQDTNENPHYAGVKRDGIEVHLQWHDESEFHTVDKVSIRFVIEDIDALFQEYRDKNLDGINEKPEKTPWGTYEFSFYDLNGNGLFFYSDL
jgi:catechol 2,3-dioxygenase-like lactoylglutathione lyase family enzyme